MEVIVDRGLGGQFTNIAPHQFRLTQTSGNILEFTVSFIPARGYLPVALSLTLQTRRRSIGRNSARGRGGGFSGSTDLRADKD